MKLNSFVSMFFLFSIILIAFIFVKDEHITAYEHITIEQGDTLWSLAGQYSGKMTEHEWIVAVKKENALRDEKIVSGQLLLVPIVKNSKYIVGLSESPEIHIIKVASENNESK
ncbi:LysM peptidoglycan-binding domain-containing protein [Solibacillus sp. R5-41]|uniref:cell division suppressor protein YneA n=1 Tax=Solibacillus sp. R5-41 TaxID=2048654 RepID=UPI0020A3D16F|nr:LysM peptidoglycan-binding domain-containing protein [Solibacillus sp. R5-41]